MNPVINEIVDDVEDADALRPAGDLLDVDLERHVR